jgi:hypothetical protein
MIETARIAGSKDPVDYLRRLLLRGLVTPTSPRGLELKAYTARVKLLNWNRREEEH